MEGIYLRYVQYFAQTTEEDCKAITEACKTYNVMLCVCHVLRYYPPNRKMKELIDSGAIGDVVSIQHLEPVLDLFSPLHKIGCFHCKPRLNVYFHDFVPLTFFFFTLSKGLE